MILLHFNPEELDGCLNVKQIYGVFGIGSEPEDTIHWGDEDVFGKRGYVQNIFCTQAVYDRAAENFSHDVLVGYDGEEEQMNYRQSKNVFEWANYSPVSTGQRYELMEKILREVSPFDKLPDNVIAIFTPDDEQYIEAPEPHKWQEYL